MLPDYIGSHQVSVPPGNRGGIIVPATKLLVEVTA
jgi:hypothetical protein